MRDYFLIGFIACAALCSGFLAGQVIDTASSAELPVFRPDARPHVAVVRIDGIENGLLTGNLHGDVRLFLRDKPVLATAGSGTFRVSAGSALAPVTTVKVPAGTQFVASKRGKKYYPVRSPAGEKLAPANRVYFNSAAEAEKAGFSK